MNVYVTATTAVVTVTTVAVPAADRRDNMLTIFEIINYAIDSKRKFTTTPTREEINNRISEIDNMANQIEYTIQNATDKIKTYMNSKLLEVLAGKIHLLCDHHLYNEALEVVSHIELNLRDYIFSDIRVLVYYYRGKYSAYDGAGLLDVSMLDDIEKAMPYRLMIGGIQLIACKVHILEKLNIQDSISYLEGLIHSNTLPAYHDGDMMYVYKELIRYCQEIGDYEKRDKYLALSKDLGE